MFISKKIVYHWLQKLYILHCLWEKEDKLYRITFPYYRRSLNKNQNISLLLQSCDQSFPFLFRRINPCINNLLFCLSAIFSRSSDPSRNMMLGINFNVLISPLICIADLALVITSKLIQWFFFINVLLRDIVFSRKIRTG